MEIVTQEKKKTIYNVYVNFMTYVEYTKYFYLEMSIFLIIVFKLYCVGILRNVGNLQ